MVRKTKGKHRLDKFYHLAKEQGFRSRAAFKLVQLNRQFHFLDRARTCLDLCAAPGGWMQVAVKTMPLNSLVIGIDLDPIRPVKGARSIVGDITTPKARAAIKKESDGSMMEVVLHDGAPNVGGVWASEAYSQSSLVLEALKLATDTLVPNGVFVTKIFRSKDYQSLLFAFNQLFRKVEATKPAASRNTSAEIFVVCQGYKAPSSIDPRLLDPKHLFEEVKEAPRAMGPDALVRQKTKQKRFREGYEDNLSTTYKSASAAAFVASEEPVEMLGRFSSFSLDALEAGSEQEELAGFLMTHPATGAEVRALLADLQVLGRTEFKQLLKWRLKVKKDFGIQAAKKAADSKSEAAEEGSEEEGSDAEEDQEEAALLAEMQDIKDGMSQRERRERKKRAKLKKVARIRSAQLAMGEGIAEQGAEDSLFSLAAIQGPVKASDIDEAEAPEEDAADSSGDDAPEPGPESEIDTDEEDRRYEAAVEAQLEEEYQQYRKRRGAREEAERKRARLGENGEIGSEDSQGEGEGEEEEGAAAIPQPEFEDDPEIGGGLLVDLQPGKRQPKTPATVAAQWFGQDLFRGVDDAMESPGRVAQPGAAPKPAAAADAEDDGADAEILVPKSAAAAAAEDRGGTARGLVVERNRADKTGADGFQVVPMSDGDSDSSEEEEEAGGDDDDGIEEPDERSAAELRALGKAMLRGRRRNDILDASYHRFTFHERGMPLWFADDERRHMRPPEVLSKDEVAAEKLRNRAIDARPVKRVAEAKARKKKRLQARLEQARKKAGAILEQGDLSERAKAKEVEALYAKAKAGGKASGKRKPSRKDRFKKKGPPLDRRLFSDKRQVQNKAKLRASKAKNKKSGGGKNKGRR